MALQIVPSKFPGISVEYDEQVMPFFLIGVSEALQLINGCPLGKKLLGLIANAAPQGGGWGAQVPPNTNVVIKAQTNRRFIQSGYKPAFDRSNPASTEKTQMEKTADPRFSNAGKDFTYVGTGSCNKGNDTGCTSDGTGTCCEVAYDSSQMMTGRGEGTTPFIVLAHELIHTYHYLYGIAKGDGEEEWTTGIGDYAEEEMSENGFRKAFGMPLRAAY